LARLQDMKRQREMERVSCPNQQMKENQIFLPTPDQMPQREAANHQDRVKWKKIRGQRDHKIRLGNDHMAASRGDLHFFDAPAKEPRPQRMRQLMTKHVQPHWLGHQ